MIYNGICDEAAVYGVNMKIFLDDTRLCPKGYEGVKSVEEFEKLVLANREHIEEISLDYDLSSSGSIRTGLSACDFLVKEKIVCPVIKIHSDHPCAVKMFDFLKENIENCDVLMEQYNILQIMKEFDE